MKYKNIRMVDVSDWDKLVTEVYGKPYMLQQQQGCMGSCNIQITVPDLKASCDAFMNDSIPETLDTELMGVKFQTWLDRDPKQPLPNQEYDFELDIWWTRNFYPCHYTLANDLYAKGKLEAGDYIIIID